MRGICHRKVYHKYPDGEFAKSVWPSLCAVEAVYPENSEVLKCHLTLRSPN